MQPFIHRTLNSFFALTICFVANTHAQSSSIAVSSSNSNTICFAKSEIKCFDANSSKALWSEKLNSDASEFYLDDGALIIADYQTLSNYLPDSGKLQWKTQFDSPIFPPTVVGESIFISDRDGAIFRVNKASGQALWSTTLDSGWNYIAANDANRLIAVGQDHKLRSFSANNGLLLYTFMLDQEPVYKPRMLNARELLVSTFANTTSSINTDTGTVNWQVKTDAPVFQSLIIGKRIIESSMDGSITAREIKNGRKIWKRKEFSSANFRVFADSNFVVAVDERGILHVFEINDGEPFDGFDTNNRQVLFPILHNSRLLNIADNGLLFTMKQ